MNDRRKFNKYIVFWLTQSLSELGSSMTSFALVIWAYGQTCSALSVSLMTFCSYVPFVIVSLFAGSFLDSHKKKSVLLLSDTFAAVLYHSSVPSCPLGKTGDLAHLSGQHPDRLYECLPVPCPVCVPGNPGS